MRFLGTSARSTCGSGGCAARLDSIRCSNVSSRRSHCAEFPRLAQARVKLHNAAALPRRPTLHIIAGYYAIVCGPTTAHLASAEGVKVSVAQWLGIIAPWSRAELVDRQRWEESALLGSLCPVGVRLPNGSPFVGAFSELTEHPFQVTEGSLAITAARLLSRWKCQKLPRNFVPLCSNSLWGHSDERNPLRLVRVFSCGLPPAQGLEPWRFERRASPDASIVDRRLRRLGQGSIPCRVTIQYGPRKTGYPFDTPRLSRSFWFRDRNER